MSTERVKTETLAVCPGCNRLHRTLPVNKGLRWVGHICAGGIYVPSVYDRSGGSGE